MKPAPPVERVGAIARRLLDDGYVQYEIDAWRTAVRLVAAYEHLGRPPTPTKVATPVAPSPTPVEPTELPHRA
jgi:hypothetical protein